MSAETSGFPEEVWLDERCFVVELMNEPAFPQVSLCRCRVEPGVTTQLHRLTVHEWYVISEGEGLLELDRSEPVAVRAGQTISIPPGTPQRVTNTGREDLIFQCVCTPRFTPECYEALE